MMHDGGPAITSDNYMSLVYIVGLTIVGSVARVLKANSSLRLRDFIAEMLTALMAAAAWWHLANLQNLNIHALAIGAISWSLGLGTIRQMQWVVRLLTAIIKAGGKP